MGQDEGKSTEGRREMGAPAPSLSDDRLYRSLASRDRRRVLFLLADEREMSVEELTTMLTGWGTTDAGTMATVDDWERVRIQLVHTHLPLLDDAGLLTYDHERGAVRLEPQRSVVTALIRQSVSASPTDPS